MEKFEALEKAMCKELEAIEQKIKSGSEMDVKDLDHADKLAHALKSLATYKAMKEAEEYEQPEYGGYSGYRGRAANGRYVSRNSAQQNYVNGYSEGYSEAMNHMRNW